MIGRPLAATVEGAMTRLHETRLLVVRRGLRSYGRLVIRRRRRTSPSSSSAIASNGRNGFDGLRTWVLSLPFVNELRGEEAAPDLREFVVDCPPLRIRRVWLVMHATGPDNEVLAFVTHGDGDLSCVGFGVPHMAADPAHVESALLLAYQRTFVGSWPSSGG
jgi:hypothetical protein